jgi:hypothetical protein
MSERRSNPSLSPVLYGGIETHPAIPGMARDIGKAMLAHGHSIPAIIDLIEQSAALSEQLIATSAAHEAVVCKAGCAWCCYPPFVSTTAAEVVCIAIYVRDTLEPSARSALIERLEQRSDSIKSMPPEQQKHARVACALLVDNRCSVHPLRPLACRGWVSSNVSACEASFATGWEAPVPNGRRNLGITAGVREGMRQALEASGLEDVRLDLTRGLLLLLREPDRIDRWLAGEAVLHEAEV